MTSTRDWRWRNLSKLNKVATVTLLIVALAVWYKFKTPAILTGIMVGAGSVVKYWR